MDSKGTRCNLCNVNLPSVALLPLHNQGKKHQKKLERQNVLQALAERSIYAFGVPKHTFSSHGEVENVFTKYGPVDKVHIDPTRGSYAVVEFVEKKSAETALSEGSIQIGEHVAVIKKRKMDFDNGHEKYEKETIDVDFIVKELIRKGGTFVEQINNLSQLFCLNSEQTTERLEYGKELTAALRHYFAPETHVYIFGSSITTVGTMDSDIDATVLFGDKPLESVKPSELDRNKYTLMTCSVEALKSRKVHSAEMARLSPADRVRFLAKILNDIRRRNLIPISDLFLVLDARCPILRFIYKRQCTIDLSIDNRLGIAKTSWIAEIVKSETSSTLRRFMVAVRFWALYHNLMRKDTDMRSHLNAYILNMLCICFLQSKQFLSPLQRGPVPLRIGKWDIDFALQPFKFDDLRLPLLLKEFFAWFVSLKTKSHVLCPRLGSLLTLKEFREAFPTLESEGFKFAQLNIQDPLELVHNISQLLSEKGLGAIRRAMVYSLSSMKKSPDSFIPSLRLISVNETHASDLLMTLPSNHRTSGECAKEITHILSELLNFEPDFMPEKKRACFNGSDFSVVNFEIKSRVWLGRRNKRRIISKDNPSLSAWEIEKMVSRAIIGEEVGAEPVNLVLRLNFQVEDNTLNVSVEHLSGEELDMHNVIHFLSQFLPKFYKGPDNQNGTSPMEL